MSFEPGLPGFRRQPKQKTVPSAKSVPKYSETERPLKNAQFRSLRLSGQGQVGDSHLEQWKAGMHRFESIEIVRK